MARGNESDLAKVSSTVPVDASGEVGWWHGDSRLVMTGARAPVLVCGMVGLGYTRWPRSRRSTRRRSHVANQSSHRSTPRPRRDVR